jgi:hypothetical protein
MTVISPTSSSPLVRVARSISSYIVPHATAHLVSNLWLIAQCAARATVDDDRRVVIEGLALAW